MDIYREEVLDHSENPRNKGELAGDDVLIADEHNVGCGDRVQFFLKVADGVIKGVKWRGSGCAIMSASASKLSEYLQSRTLKELRELDEEQLVKVGVGFEVNPGRVKCLTLPVLAVKRFLKN